MAEPIALVQPATDPFDAFWAVYPRREAKKDALKAWTTCLDPKDYPVVLEAALAWRNVWRQQGKETQYIKLPATWIRGECWNDEIPPEFQRKSQASIPVQVGPSSVAHDSCRSPIPPSVQAFLNQMKVRR